MNSRFSACNQKQISGQGFRTIYQADNIKLCKLVKRYFRAFRYTHAIRRQRITSRPSIQTISRTLIFNQTRQGKGKDRNSHLLRMVNLLFRLRQCYKLLESVHAFGFINSKFSRGCCPRGSSAVPDPQGRASRRVSQALNQAARLQRTRERHCIGLHLQERVPSVFSEQLLLVQQELLTL